MKYKCNKCGKEHDEWPALTFNAPLPYMQLNDEEKENIAEIGSDFCIITYPDQIDRFIRVAMIQKVNDSCQDLHYGLWVSVSEKSFEDYKANYKDIDYQNTYYARICNNIPGYESTFAISANVDTQTGNNRPIVVPHQSIEHPFIADYYNGISVAEAEKRVAALNS